MLIANNEEITRWRWVKKALTLPATAVRADAELWFCVHQYVGSREPLQVDLNGRPLGRLAAHGEPCARWDWLRLPVPAGRLKTGQNEIVLRCETPAMNAWVLAVENGHRDPRSYVSNDRGRTWRNSAMGAHNILRGEYIIRLRSLAPGLQPRTPPVVVHEDSRHPRVQELLTLIPVETRRIGDRWKQVLSLRSWLSQQWPHCPHGASYAPWDPWTILDWTKRDGGHTLKTKIAMCVHFGSMFAALVSALGHKARCIINTRGLGTSDGHFMTEVWSDAFGKWVLHDGNIDVHYEENGRPFSAFELADRAHRGLTLEKCIRSGPGLARQPPHLADFYKNIILTGKGWNLTGVWTRNNYISDPTAAPPNHGSVAYAETDIVWYNPPGMDLTPMFPYCQSDRSWFDRQPSSPQKGRSRSGR